MGPKLKDDYVKDHVCSGCPFRKESCTAVRLEPFAARRIADDLTHDRMFPCHKTTHPEGLSDKLLIADRGDWRFCAGAYLSMSSAERAGNVVLRTMGGLGYHNPDTPPAGEKLVFDSLDEFIRYYNY